MPLTWWSGEETGRKMQGFHCMDEYYELFNLYSPDPSYALRNVGRSVMVNEGADIEQVGVQKTPNCHGSASSSQEEEQNLISLERNNIFTRRRSVDEDPTVKNKLRGFYCVTVLFCMYTSAYFTYLIVTQR